MKLWVGGDIKIAVYPECYANAGISKPGQDVDDEPAKKMWPKRAVLFCQDLALQPGKVRPLVLLPELLPRNPCGPVRHVLGSSSPATQDLASNAGPRPGR